MDDDYKIITFDDSPIVIQSGFELSIELIIQSVLAVNKKFVSLSKNTSKIAFNVFEVVDFRMLSGLLGEALVSDLSTRVDALLRNPNIDGYPDLVDVSQRKFREDFEKWKEFESNKFIKYPYGGIEIKNTFGTKKSGVHLLPGDNRINKINNKLDWKAHHRTTNNLLGIFSDFVNRCPQIIAVMYCDKLEESDWAEKQNPKEGSTMTSFSVIKSSGWVKLKKGIKFCIDEPNYINFFTNKND